MKKIIVLLAAMSVAPAFAAGTPVCTGTTAGTVTVAKASTPLFLVNNFDMKCSANVFLSYEETSVVMAVGSASAKGKNIFAGSSAGGAVAPTGACAATTGCTADEATAAAEAALLAAGSAGGSGGSN